MKGKSLRTVLIAGSALLAFLIYLAPSQLNPGNEVQTESEEVKVAADDDEALLMAAKAALDSLQRNRLAEMEQGSGIQEGDTTSLRNMGLFWDTVGVPAASAIWFSRKAEKAGGERDHLEAAYRFFDAFRLAPDSGLKAEFVRRAIGHYTRVLELNPGNLNAKTDLGACYAEGTAEPMKGIMMLREVVATDPKHEMAQYNLGMLSVKSGQLDKAIDRFKTVLEINPGRSEVHYHLGNVWLQKGDTATAVTEYEQFIKVATVDVSDLIRFVETLKKRDNGRSS